VEALLEHAIEAGLDGLSRLERQAREVAHRFRARAIADARHGLHELIAATERVADLAAASADATGEDLTTFCEERDLPAETTTAALMSELVRHQRADDAHALASALEHRFAGVIEAWRQVFFALGEPPTDPSGHAA
jgi:hypothetical protein